MMYFQGAMVRRVESTSGISEGCGLLKRPTSMKAVTRRNPPEGFLMRNDGLRCSWRRTVLGSVEAEVKANRLPDGAHGGRVFDDGVTTNYRAIVRNLAEH